MLYCAMRRAGDSMRFSQGRNGLLRLHRGGLPCRARGSARLQSACGLPRGGGRQRPRSTSICSYAAVLIATANRVRQPFSQSTRFIRTQVREEGKLRAMTAALSHRSETLQHAPLTDPFDRHAEPSLFFDEALREYLDAFATVQEAARAPDRRPRSRSS